MSLDPVKWIKALKERRQEIMENCFTSAPSDYAGFQRCLGQFQENELVTQTLKDKFKELQGEDEK